MLGSSALTPLAPKLPVLLGLIPSTTKIETTSKSIKQLWAFGIQHQEVEAGGLGVQGCPLLYSKFMPSLGSKKPCLKGEADVGTISSAEGGFLS